MLEALSVSAAYAAKAGAAGKGCKLVAFPTESCYAIGSTGLIKAATRRILQVKGRPSLKPFAVMVHSTEAAKTWVEWTPLAAALAAKFWPGPLLLLLKPTAQGRLLTFPEYPTVAIRVPAHAAARADRVLWRTVDLYQRQQIGETGAVDRRRRRAEFGADIDLIIDGGTVPNGDPTLVDASGEKPRIIRLGLIRAESIQEAPAP